MSTTYFVTWRPNGGFVSILTLDEMRARVSSGELQESLFATESNGQSFQQFRRSDRQARWRTLAELLAESPGESSGHQPPDEQQGSDARPALPLWIKAGREYPALRALAVWYTVLAVLSGIAAGIGCLLGLAAFTRDNATGLTTTVAFLVAGAISIVTLLAFAEGIKLAINVATDVKEIRDRISKANAEPSDAREASTPA
jgi:hypothetical protein